MEALSSRKEKVEGVKEKRGPGLYGAITPTSRQPRLGGSVCVMAEDSDTSTPRAFAPNPFLPPVVFFWLSSKLDPVSKLPKMSSGTYMWCSLCIWMGIPLPSFHTEIEPFSASMVTWDEGGVSKRLSGSVIAPASPSGVQVVPASGHDG